MHIKWIAYIPNMKLIMKVVAKVIVLGVHAVMCVHAVLCMLCGACCAVHAVL